MAIILITYGDERFKKSLKRLKKEAKVLGIFDKIICYKPKDLPLYIKSSPLMAFTRLGGYAVWKSYIIFKTYKDSYIGDTIIYVDAGCSLQQSIEWNHFDELLGNEGTIVFQYRPDVDYGFKDKYGINANNTNKTWIKKSVKEYFRLFFKNDEWLNTEKIWSGALIVRKGSAPNVMLEQWYTVTLMNPELSMDVYGKEFEEQDSEFVEHRHDQALLSVFVFFFKNKQKIILIPETSESQKETAAIVASRITDKIKPPFFLRFKRYFKSLIGRSVVDFIKRNSLII